MKVLFAPGCALRAYKPELVSRLADFLTENRLIDGIYLECCKLEQNLNQEFGEFTEGLKPKGWID